MEENIYEYTDEQQGLIELIEITFKDWIELKVLNFTGEKVLLKDSDEFKYLTTPRVIKNAQKRGLKLSKFFRSNPYTRDNIINYLKINDMNIELISEDINNAKEKLTWRCLEHGIFEMSWNRVKVGQSCPVCGKIKAAAKTRNSYEYVSKSFADHGHILISDTYINNLLPLEFICSKHKDSGTQTTSFGNLITKQCVCTFCNKEKHRQKQMKTQEQFEAELEEIHQDTYMVIGEYNGANKHINLVCNICKSPWSTKPTHLLNGHGCPRCASVSLGEEKVRNILMNWRVAFKEEYRIDDCRNIKPLPFDFAIFDKSDGLTMLIEYDGRQHFEPCGFGEKCEDTINAMFEQTQERDKIKTQYCQNNNIPLLRIPYWDFNSIEKILEDNLNIKFNKKEGDIDEC